MCARIREVRRMACRRRIDLGKGKRNLLAHAISEALNEEWGGQPLSAFGETSTAAQLRWDKAPRQSIRSWSTLPEEREREAWAKATGWLVRMHHLRQHHFLLRDRFSSFSSLDTTNIDFSLPLSALPPARRTVASFLQPTANGAGQPHGGIWMEARPSPAAKSQAQKTGMFARSEGSCRNCRSETSSCSVCNALHGPFVSLSLFPFLLISLVLSQSRARQRRQEKRELNRQMWKRLRMAA